MYITKTTGVFMKFERQSGVLLHPTSLPSSYGIGTLGDAAYKFIDWLLSAGQGLWQVLPLGPTGYGDSPYASFSTFAGNPLLIDLNKLLEKDWACKDDIKVEDYIKKEGNIDFGAVVWWKTPILRKCAKYFLENATSEDKKIYKNFCKKSWWLENFALFMSIKTVYDKKAQEEKPENSVWYAYWPKDLASHNKEALEKWKSEYSEDVEIYKVIQFFFDYQWQQLKKYANEEGIKIIGDIPIFVAPDSADVWSNQEFFQLDENGKPNCVAGVPPDYFSAEGQLWGNPLYDWDKMKASGYKWWIQRIERVFELTDVLRVDHFRGFEAYWSVPFGDKTAINGKWCKGPDIDFFKVIKKKLGDIPVIAEDLGVITQEVRLLRDKSGFPGMKVLQFAFSESEIKENGFVNGFMPHMYESQNCVVYTGTHDNDTLQGWLEKIEDKLLLIVAQYFTGAKTTVEKAKSMVKNGTLRKAMIKATFASNAIYAIVPMQDIIGCGNEARMNMPSTTGSNWTWRMTAKDLKKNTAEELDFWSTLYGRNQE